MEPIQNIVFRHNGTSSMCNQVYRTRPDDGPAAQAHSAAPMGASDRPCEAVLAVSCLCCAHHAMLLEGGAAGYAG